MSHGYVSETHGGRQAVGEKGGGKAIIKIRGWRRGRGNARREGCRQYAIAAVRQPDAQRQWRHQTASGSGSLSQSSQSVRSFGRAPPEPVCALRCPWIASPLGLPPVSDLHTQGQSTDKKHGREALTLTRLDLRRMQYEIERDAIET
jgi:hypothetical protein